LVLDPDRIVSHLAFVHNAAVEGHEDQLAGVRGMVVDLAALVEGGNLAEVVKVLVQVGAVLAMYIHFGLGDNHSAYDDDLAVDYNLHPVVVGEEVVAACCQPCRRGLKSLSACELDSCWGEERRRSSLSEIDLVEELRQRYWRKPHLSDNSKSVRIHSGRPG